jgi:hypothetical protein
VIAINPELSFYQIPTDMKLRNMWLHWIGRASFKSNKCHRVCSKHFVGGKKTCLHNVPTVVQKVFLPTPTKPRTTFKCVNRRDPNEDRRIINEQAEQLTSSRNKISMDQFFNGPIFFFSMDQFFTIRPEPDLAGK